MNQVTLQINLAPGDIKLLDHILPHQLRVLMDQVAEVLLTCDIRPTRGRFHVSPETRDRFLEHMERFAQADGRVKLAVVDYAEDAIFAVAQDLRLPAPIPVKDYRGGPFYCYFFGLSRATHDHILHLDSDLLIGGNSQTWIREAVALLRNDPLLFAVKPWSGPPRRLPRKDGPQRTTDNFTTRSFLVNKERLRELCSDMRYTWPGLARSIYAISDRNPAVATPESLISRAMKARGWRRADFLGLEAELWTLHPPFRCGDFYRKLPDIIRMVEEDRVPDEQRGHYDINRSLVDWSEAIRSFPLWRRLWLRSRRLDSLT